MDHFPLWKFKMKGTSFPRFAFRPELAVHQLCKFHAEGKPDTGAALFWHIGPGGLIKAVEDMGQVVGVDAPATVLHADADLPPKVFCRYGNAATRRRELESIGQEVVHQFFYLFFIEGQGQVFPCVVVETYWMPFCWAMPSKVPTIVFRKEDNGRPPPVGLFFRNPFWSGQVSR